MALLDSLGKRIKALRADRGMSQKDLAKLISTAQSHLSEIESDNVPRVSGYLVGRIAVSLSTTSDYLLLLTDDPMPLSAIRGEEVDPQIVALSRKVRSLPSHLREQGIGFLGDQLDTFVRLFASER
jgi:transcriptional regulator with XRE-family HTH domain